MHDAAYKFVKDHASTDAPDYVVIEVGSRDINGSVRDLFPNAHYTGIDAVEGKGVDVVASGVDYKPRKRAHIVICCEVFEHTDEWRDIVANIHDAMLVKGGRFIMTAAGPNRRPHSAVDGGPLRDDEHYENIHPIELETVMVGCGFTDVVIDTVDADVRAIGIKS